MAFTNRLIKEKSPYLLQHAHNPVDWYPWTSEAFDLARKEDKPIFLSIGYATCHWCHVMESESFENPEIAQLLNDTFINIKVDREEHPEVDSIYMEFAQALMASPGGWPLNLVLTPDLKPFFAVTYLPPVTRSGLIGLDQFTKQIQQLWSGEERPKLIEQANKMVELFGRLSTSKGEQLPDSPLLDAAIQMLFDVADPVYGGLKGEPKFPIGYQSRLLLQYSKAHNDGRCLFYVKLTLEMMRRGGLFDQIGGGFARYCVDQKWLVPHFEKMLYDNAILAETYLDAYLFTKEEKFQVICQRVCDYAMREMRSAEGGFFSAEDADSEGHEGKFYTWTPQEVSGALAKEEADLFCQFYHVKEPGNFEGRSILYIEMDESEFASQIGQPPQEVSRRLQASREKLLEKRSQRPHPFKDDKITTSWNGLMIHSLARAGASLKRADYTQAALASASFIQDKLQQEGKLLHRYREGEARFVAGLEDHAFLIRALLTLFELGQGTRWLKWAVELAEEVEKSFKSAEGAYYQSVADPHLLIRKCEFYDGAEPSGNAVHTENLLRLYQITQQEKYLLGAESVLKAAKSFIETFPPGACYHLLSLQRYLDRKAPLVLIALGKEGIGKQELLDLLAAHFSPHASFAWKEDKDPLFEELLPFCKEQLPVSGKTTIYICQGQQCLSPLTEKEALIEALSKL